MAGERLDKALAHFLSDYSRNRLQAWATQGAVLVDGKVVKARQILRGGEQIRVFPQEMPEQHAFCQRTSHLIASTQMTRSWSFIK